MENWGDDNFANEGARDYLAVLTARLVATITEILADEERCEPDEDGESMLMPSIDVLALLCERYNATPPKAATVQQWHQKYGAAFDRCIDRMNPPAGFKQSRRKMIDQTFRWLESLATTYWEQ